MILLLRVQCDHLLDAEGLHSRQQVAVMHRVSVRRVVCCAFGLLISVAQWLLEALRFGG